MSHRHSASPFVARGLDGSVLAVAACLASASCGGESADNSRQPTAGATSIAPGGAANTAGHAGNVMDARGGGLTNSGAPSSGGSSASAGVANSVATTPGGSGALGGTSPGAAGTAIPIGAGATGGTLGMSGGTGPAGGAVVTAGRGMTGGVPSSTVQLGGSSGSFGRGGSSATGGLVAGRGPIGAAGSVGTGGNNLVGGAVGRAGTSSWGGAAARGGSSTGVAGSENSCPPNYVQQTKTVALPPQSSPTDVAAVCLWSGDFSSTIPAVDIALTFDPARATHASGVASLATGLSAPAGFMSITKVIMDSVDGVQLTVGGRVADGLAFDLDWVNASSLGLGQTLTLHAELYFTCGPEFSSTRNISVSTLVTVCGYSQVKSWVSSSEMCTGCFPQ